MLLSCLSCTGEARVRYVSRAEAVVTAEGSPLFHFPLSAVISQVTNMAAEVTQDSLTVPFGVSSLAAPVTALVFVFILILIPPCLLSPPIPSLGEAAATWFVRHVRVGE